MDGRRGADGFVGVLELGAAAFLADEVMVSSNGLLKSSMIALMSFDCI